MHNKEAIEMMSRCSAEFDGQAPIQVFIIDDSDDNNVEDD